METTIEIKLLKENFNDLMLKFDEICDSFVEFKALLFNFIKKKVIDDRIVQLLGIRVMDTIYISKRVKIR